MKWTRDNIPDQSGRTAIVTGANSGIGYETARALAHRGANVLFACRDRARAEAAVARLRAEGPKGRVTLDELDLGNLASVKSFAERVLASPTPLHLLVANAGVMMPPRRTETADGFELQLGTNHLGHFALVGHLLPKLLATAASRVVVVSSFAHKWGVIRFDDLQWKTRRYATWSSYAQSKLANLLFAYELQRRLEQAGSTTTVTAAHPGWTSTHLQRNIKLGLLFNRLFAMRPEKGALSTLYAATAANAQGGELFGPDGLWEVWGSPKKVESIAASHDRDVAERLWQVSEELTGVRYLSPSR